MIYALPGLPLDGVVLELPVAVALEEDLAGARQLRVEEPFARAAARAASASCADVEFDGVLPAHERVRVDEERLPGRQRLVRDDAHGPNKGHAVALDDLADQALTTAAAGQGIRIHVEVHFYGAQGREERPVLGQEATPAEVHRQYLGGADGRQCDVGVVLLGLERRHATGRAGDATAEAVRLIASCPDALRHVN